MQKIVNYLAGGLLLLSSFSLMAQTNEVSFSIKPQLIKNALLDYSKQADVQIVLSQSIPNDIVTSELKGKMTASQALNHLTKQANLNYEFTNKKTVIIKTSANNDLALALQEDDDEGDDTAEDENVVRVVGRRVVSRDRTDDIKPVLSYDKDYFQRFEPDTLEDILQRVSGVFITAGGEIRFRNLDQQYGQILINGRRVLGIEAFSALPASQIKKVEVIRGSSAELDGQGVALTLNVILNDDGGVDQTSWRTTARSQDGEPSFLSSIAHSGSTDSIVYSASLSYQDTTDVTIDKDESFVPTSYYDADGSATIFDSEDIFSDENISFNGTLGYELDSGAELSATLRYTDRYSSSNSKSIEQSSDTFDPIDLDNPMLSGSKFINAIEEFDIALSYEQSLSDTIDFEVEVARQRAIVDTIIISTGQQIEGGFDPISFVYSPPSGPAGLNLQGEREEQINTDIKTRFDFELSEVSKLITGIQARRETTDSLGAFAFGDTRRTFDVTNDRLNPEVPSIHDIPDLSYEEVLSAVDLNDPDLDAITETNRIDFFLSYQHKLSESVSLELGVRYETSEIDLTNFSTIQTGNNYGGGPFGDFQRVADISFSKDFKDTLPSVNLRWKIDKNQDLRVSLAQTVRRPNRAELNPSIRLELVDFEEGFPDYDIADTNASINATFGDPDLKREKSTGLDTQYDFFFDERRGVVGVNLFHRDIDNLIRQPSLISGDKYQAALDRLFADPQALETFNQFVTRNTGRPFSRISGNTFANADESSSTGIEFDASLPLDIFGLPQLNVYFNYSYVKFEGISSGFDNAGNPVDFDFEDTDGSYTFGLDHEIGSGFQYGFSLNGVTESENEETIINFSDQLVRSKITRNRDDALEIYFQQDLSDDMVLRFNVRNALSAETERLSVERDVVTNAITDQNNGFTEQEPLYSLTLRGTF